jgi:hypothetical protein
MQCISLCDYLRLIVVANSIVFILSGELKWRRQSTHTAFTIQTRPKAGTGGLYYRCIYSGAVPPPQFHFQTCLYEKTDDVIMAALCAIGNNGGEDDAQK